MNTIREKKKKAPEDPSLKRSELGSRRRVRRISELVGGVRRVRAPDKRERERERRKIERERDLTLISLTKQSFLRSVFF